MTAGGVRERSGDYAGESVGYPYVDMFQNYVSKIPVIQEYLKA